MKLTTNKIEDTIQEIRYARAEYIMLIGETPKKMIVNDATHRLLLGAVFEVFGTIDVSLFEMGISVHEEMEDGEVFFAPF